MPITPDPALEAEIARLDSLNLQELRQYWAERLGPVPDHRSADLMRRRIAYALQVRAYGGLKPETKRRLRADPRWRKPALWAGYVLIGDPPAVAERRLPWGWIGLAALAAAAILIGWRSSRSAKPA